MTLLESAYYSAENRLKLRCLSTEYEILLLLYELGYSKPTVLLTMQKSSSSTFYNCVGKLHHNGLINIDVDGNDRRQSLYSLTAFARGVLDENWDKIQAWTRGRGAGESGTLSEP